MFLLFVASIIYCFPCRLLLLAVAWYCLLGVRARCVRWPTLLVLCLITLLSTSLDPIARFFLTYSLSKSCVHKPATPFKCTHFVCRVSVSVRDVHHATHVLYIARFSPSADAAVTTTTAVARVSLQTHTQRWYKCTQRKKTAVHVTK